MSREVVRVSRVADTPNDDMWTRDTLTRSDDWPDLPFITIAINEDAIERGLIIKQ